MKIEERINRKIKIEKEKIRQDREDRRKMNGLD